MLETRTRNNQQGGEVLRLTTMVTMIVPVAYDNIKASCSVIDSLRRDSSNQRWRNNIETTKRLSFELSKELGIDQNQWETMIVKTLKRSSNDAFNTDWENQDMPRKRLRLIMDNHSEKHSKRAPKIMLNDMNDKIIKECTGFPSLSAMLCYIMVINKGNIDELINNTTTRTMTWFEEWMLVFEILWGRSIGRWCDARQKYGLSEKHLSVVLDKK
jgi:hypothetical protein